MSNGEALTKLGKLSADLRRLPTVVAQKAAAAAAPALTDAARSTFDAGEDPYGATWAIREDGTRATLRDSGALSSKVRYVAIGTRIRLALGVAYAKYVVGRRPVFPKQGATLPKAYSDALQGAVAEVCRAELGQS